MFKSHAHIGIDSHCLSYLLDAITGIVEPTDSLAGERKALIRIWFYALDAYFVTPTVVEECKKIRDAERKEFHRNFIDSLFCDPQTRDAEYVKNRTTALLCVHAKVGDCKILAESEEIELDVLLTYDQRFLRRLGHSSASIRLMTPSAHWESLRLPHGAQPRTKPHQTNPLSTQTWWRW